MFIKKLVSMLLALAVAAAMVPFTAAYAAGTVSVALPQFSVTLNGQTTSNLYSQYPLLVYRDITYFPMTYYDCRLLGLKTSWSTEDGLSIEKNDESISEYVREIRTSQNSSSQRAEIAEGKIQVNGKVVDNSREQYPLLLFRDVTYFPLTWRFAVDEFGWEYHFDMENGLVISNPAAQFACEEAWEGDVADEGFPVMGTGSLGIVCAFGVDPDSGGHIPSGGIRCYNMTGSTIRFLPDDFCWEYRLYKIISSREELVYRKAIPFYYGELNYRCSALWSINDTYWNGNFSAGGYRAELVHPEEYLYQVIETGEIVSAPTTDSGAYAVTFSDTFTVK